MRGKLDRFNGPYYDLNTAKECVEQNRFVPTSTVEDGLINHHYSLYLVTGNVFSLMQASDYYKTTELIKRPGVYADIYNVEYDGEIWYVKFWINKEDEQAYVELWSLKCWG